MGSALILAGHGSHISPNTAGLVWRHVDYLRSQGVADEVTAAFWKEKPSFARVLETVTAPAVTIVPLFTSRGFFTQLVIPAEMGLTGELTHRDGREIRYA
ncbi:MAG: CbiX/SirB N-terminal domain-containing protein, partial [Acidobacteriota bacterium]